MRRSDRPTENLENEAGGELKAKRKKSNDKISNIAAMDNGTMVEAFKFLNYCQLATNGRVSKRFRNLIQSHRNSLALLCIQEIGIYSRPHIPEPIKIFDEELSSEAYDEWVIRNNYSKQAPFDDQVASTQSTQDEDSGYLFSVSAHYKDPNNRKREDKTSVLCACVEFNDDNWPMFQHFVRLLTDPFIYIDSASLTDQNAVLNLIDRAINPDLIRLQFNRLLFHLRGNDPKSFSWLKNHVRCNEVYGLVDDAFNQDEALLDFFVTGGHCTPSIEVAGYDVSKAMVDFVEKFLDLENSDEYQSVLSIEGFRFNNDQDGASPHALKNDYAKYIIKEGKDGHDDDRTTYVFEFVNNAIGKKLQLTVTIIDDAGDCSVYSLKIENL
ncbi:hypothetical protein Ddc_15457 [Ditylenchus destructor]|nr:hypothetical protein Ddc_15457 [Ditylenchus destructor]